MAIVGTQGGEQEVGGMEEPRAQEENQRRRERVVLLMHDTKVLTASDATRLLLLLAQEVCVLRHIGGESQASTMGLVFGLKNSKNYCHGIHDALLVEPRATRNFPSYSGLTSCRRLRDMLGFRCCTNATGGLMLLVLLLPRFQLCCCPSMKARRLTVSSL